MSSKLAQTLDLGISRKKKILMKNFVQSQFLTILGCDEVYTSACQITGFLSQDFKSAIIFALAGLELKIVFYLKKSLAIIPL